MEKLTTKLRKAKKVYASSILILFFTLPPKTKLLQIYSGHW